MTSNEEIVARAGILKAIYELVKEKYGEAASEAREVALGLAKQGASAMPVIVCGQKVGTVTVPYSPPQPVVTDCEAFAEWAVGAGMGSWELDPGLIPKEDAERLRADHPEWFRAVDDPSAIASVGEANGATVCAATGEEVPGVAWSEGRAKTPQVRGCKPADVAAALATRRLTIGDAINALGDGR